MPLIALSHTKGEHMNKFYWLAMSALMLAGVPVAYAQRNATLNTRNEPVLKGPVVENPVDVLDFWTDERMDEAWPSHNPPQPPPILPPLLPGADQSGYVVMPEPYNEHRLSRMVGILFYRDMTGGLAHCTASVIHSHTKSLLITAAHCVTQSAENTWNNMLMFVPAYNGTGRLKTPLGKWPIRRVFIPYQRAGVVSVDDIAVAQVFSKTAPIGPGVTIESMVGGGLQPRTSETENFEPAVKIIGYPGVWYAGDGPYEGEQRRCDTPIFNLPDSSFSSPHCAIQGGHSGGPLVFDTGIPGAYEVVGVVNSGVIQARLKLSTFGRIYRAADIPRRKP